MPGNVALENGRADVGDACIGSTLLTAGSHDVTLDGDAPSVYCVQGQTATVYATGNKGSVGTGRLDLHR